jgi:hypothetical protein
MLNRMSLLITIGVLAVGGSSSFGQEPWGPCNLLNNPFANEGSTNWTAYGKATVEDADGGTACFVVRDRGYFHQDVGLPADAAGKYALLIGAVSSERINTDGAITGLPYLYGYMLSFVDKTGARILEYLQGQQMLCSAKTTNQWVTAWGVYRIPEGTKAIRFFLMQAERNGVPQNGSAARFDNLGLFLFPTKESAESFVMAHPNGAQLRE